MFFGGAREWVSAPLTDGKRQYFRIQRWRFVERPLGASGFSTMDSDSAGASRRLGHGDKCGIYVFPPDIWKYNAISV